MNITEETKPLYEEIERLNTALKREEQGRLDAISDSAAWQRKYGEACDRIAELIAERVATPNDGSQRRDTAATDCGGDWQKLPDGPLRKAYEEAAAKSSNAKLCEPAPEDVQ